MSKHVTFLCDQCETPCDPRVMRVATLSSVRVDEWDPEHPEKIPPAVSIDLCEGCFEGAKIYFSKALGKLECTESPQDRA